MNFSANTILTPKRICAAQHITVDSDVLSLSENTRSAFVRRASSPAAPRRRALQASCPTLANAIPPRSLDIPNRILNHNNLINSIEHPITSCRLGEHDSPRRYLQLRKILSVPTASAQHMGHCFLRAMMRSAHASQQHTWPHGINA